MRLSEKKLKELKDKKILIENIYEKYFYTQKDGVNIENVLKLMDENICSFKEIVDRFKRIRDDRYNPCLKYLLSNKKLFDELIQNNILNQEDSKYLLNKIDDYYELRNLNENTSLLKHIVDKSLFKELIDKFKNFNKFRSLLENKELFKELMQSNRLNTEDLRYLLNKITRGYGLDRLLSDLAELCDNTPLIKYVLNEFVLDKELIDRFNVIVENRWCKEHNIHTIFELIEYRNKNNKEVLKLNELNEKIYTFDLSLDQKLELAKVLRNNEIAQNRLIQIIEIQLEDTYNFDSLMVYLSKTEKKNILNI